MGLKIFWQFADGKFQYLIQQGFDQAFYFVQDNVDGKYFTDNANSFFCQINTLLNDRFYLIKNLSEELFLSRREVIMTEFQLGKKRVNFFLGVVSQVITSKVLRNPIDHRFGL